MTQPAWRRQTSEARSYFALYPLGLSASSLICHFVRLLVNTNGMTLSQKSIDEYKEIFKKEYGKELTDAEAYESAHNLVNFFKILMEGAEEDFRRKRRLKKEPDGFYLDGGPYSCLICRQNIPVGQAWYDQWGQKCSLCQKAVKERIVPGFVCRARDSWFATWELKSKFKIHPATARKMVRLGQLKARIVPAENGAPYEYVFLKKENPGLISRYSAERKSYDRHRKKVSEAQIREERKKLRLERERTKKKNRR